MKKATAFLLVIGLFSFAVLSYAADREDAKALVKRAAAYVSIRGKTRRWQRSARPRGCLTRVNFMYSRTIFRASCLPTLRTVSYTHLRAHETVLDLVCRL